MRVEGVDPRAVLTIFHGKQRRSRPKDKTRVSPTPNVDLTLRILSYVASNPGCNVKQIRGAVVGDQRTGDPAKLEAMLKRATDDGRLVTSKTASRAYYSIKKQTAVELGLPSGAAAQRSIEMASSRKGKVTSPRAASAASQVLRDRRTSKTSKTAAGSALAQKPAKGKATTAKPKRAPRKAKKA